MRVAIIGSRGIDHIPNLEELLPADTRRIVSGGARGVDTLAREYAKEKGLELLEFLPDYARFGRGAPLKRNITIIENADLVLAFWDGKSRGTRFVIEKCREMGVECRVLMTERAKAEMRKEEKET